MPLEPPKLDDLTWSDLTSTARDRIAPISRGDWTLHAPVDPGITLLELFAAQLEQRLYMLDQPSDDLTAALLKLVGIRPRPVGIAATVLQFRDAQSSPPSLETVNVNQRTLLLDDEPLAFRTQHDFAWLPIHQQRRRRRQRDDHTQPVSLIVGDEDRTKALQSGRAPCLFSGDGNVRETKVIITLRDGSGCFSKPGDHKPISILFDLEVPDVVSPQWEEEFRQDVDCTWRSASDGTRRSSCIASVSPAADITWEYQVGENEYRKLEDVEDGTGAFRRPGIVRLTLPANPDLWTTASQAFGRIEAGCRPTLCLRIRATNVSYSFLPRVKQIVPNAVIARHRREAVLSDEDRQRLAQQIFDWRPLPGNLLELPQDEFGDRIIPQPARSDAENCIDDWDARYRNWQRLPAPVRLRIRERGGAHRTEWTARTDLSQLGPADRFFTVDRQRGRLGFGDGLTGRIPMPERFYDAAEPERPRDPDPVDFDLEYEVGGGEKGNRPACLTWKSIPEGNPGTQDWNAVNVVPCAGGSEPQSMEDAARSAKSSLWEPTRAVTRKDIEKLAKSTPGAGVARAYAAVGFVDRHRCLPVPGAVTVFIVPGLPSTLRRSLQESCGCEDLNGLSPDPGVLQAVAQWLNPRRLLTHEIHVARPEYVEVDLRVKIEGSPSDPDDLRRTVQEALHVYLHPLFGGPESDGWPFGEPLRPSQLVKTVQETIDNDLHVAEVSVGVRSKRPASEIPGQPSSSIECHSGIPTAVEFESCRETVIPGHSLVALRSVSVTFKEPVLATSGGLS